MALKQQYERLLTDYDQLCQMVMEIRSRMSVDTCAAPFSSYSPENNQPPPPPLTPLLF